MPRSDKKTKEATTPQREHPEKKKLIYIYKYILYYIYTRYILLILYLCIYTPACTSISWWHVARTALQRRTRREKKREGRLFAIVATGRPARTNHVAWEKKKKNGEYHNTETAQTRRHADTREDDGMRCALIERPIDRSIYTYLLQEADGANELGQHVARLRQELRWVAEALMVAVVEVVVVVQKKNIQQENTTERRRGGQRRKKYICRMGILLRYFSEGRLI